MGKKGQGQINWLSWHGVNWQAMRESDRVNDKRTTAWAFAWVVSLALARLPVAFDWVPPVLGWLLAALCIAVGAQFVRSYLRMVREADELLREVQLEGLSVGFGAGLICGFTSLVFVQPSPWLALAILMAMTLGYVVTVLKAAHAAAGSGE
jgi:hypothetical protein